MTDYKLEDYILSCQWSDFPEEVKQRARGCLLDLIGALIIGSNGKQFENGIKLAKDIYAKGEIPVIGSCETFNLVGATVTMSHASNSFDIDDGHNLIKGHPGTSFFPGLLASALKYNKDLCALLTGLVLGYDVAVRVGLAIQDFYGFLHSTGCYGAVATAAIVGKIMNFDRYQLNTAISIADFHAPLTPVMRSVEYPSMNKDGVPFGALIGIMAVEETLAGTSGKIHTLEIDNEIHLLDDLGKNYEIMNLYFKPYTCCRWTHQPIKAILDLKKEHNITFKDIKHIDVYSFKAACQLSKIIPKTTDEAQYNIAWPVASSVVFEDVGYNQVCDAALSNQDVIDTMNNLEFHIDEKLDKEFPQKRLARVEVTLGNGDVIKSRIYSAEGEATDNINNVWLAKKFRRVTQPLLSNNVQERIIEAIFNSSLRTSVRDIIHAINTFIQ